MGKNKKIPGIRFKGFSEDWEQRKLGELVKESAKIEPEDPSQLELLTVRLHFKGIVPTGEKPKPTKGGRPYYIRNKDELIIGRQNFHNGGFGIADKEVDGLIASNAIQSFDFNEDVNPYFLLMNMRRKDWLAKTEIEVGGTGQKEYSVSVLKSLKIYSTHFNEQEQIGAFFKNLDNLITLHKRKLDNLQTYKKTMLSKMFPRNDKNVPEFRFKGFTDAWEQRKFGKVAEIVRGASPRPIQDPKWFDKQSDVGWLRISDVTEQDGRIYHLEQHISELGQEKTRVLTEPHLLLSIAATVGKPVINYVKTGVHDGFLIFLRPEFDREFMFQWLEMFRPMWQKYGQPGSQVNLNSDLVKNQEVFLPSYKEQEKIGAFFEQLDNLITLHQRKLENLQEKKEYFLSHMFA